MSTQAERNLSVSVREQKRLMREHLTATQDMQRIYKSLTVPYSAQGINHARDIAKQWLDDRGLL